MPISKALLAAKRKFAGQTAHIPVGQFDNSPFTEGNHTMEVVRAEIRDKEDKDTGDKRPTFFLMLRAVDGEDKGKNCFPYIPYLDTVDDIAACMRTVGTILGDEKTPWVDSDGNADIGAFLEVIEELAPDCIGEVLEVRCKNGNRMRVDGTPFQNFWVNRSLGEDAAGHEEQRSTRKGSEKVEPDDNLDMSPSKGSKKKVTKKKTTKKKMAKKKVTKKKKR